MQINGQDVWVYGRFTTATILHVVRAVAARWPQAVVEHADGRDLGAVQTALSADFTLPCELFFYLNEDARQAWDDLGRTDYNSEHMLYCIIQPDCATLVSEGATIPMAQALLESVSQSPPRSR